MLSLIVLYSCFRSFMLQIHCRSTVDLSLIAVPAALANVNVTGIQVIIDAIHRDLMVFHITLFSHFCRLD